MNPGVRIFACIAIFLPLFLPAAETAVSPPPAEAFGQVPSIGDVKLNPRGNLLAWCDSSGGAQRVVIYDLDTLGEKRSLAMLPGTKLRGVDWADDETVLIRVSVTKEAGPRGRHMHEWFRVLAADVAGGTARILLMRDGARSWVTGATLIASRIATPKTVIMSSLDFSPTKQGRETGTRLVGGRKDSGWIHNLFAVDTRTGTGKLIDVGTQFTDSWIVDRDGQPVARSEWDPQRHVYRILRRNGAGWDEIYRQDGGQLTLHGLASDALIAVGARGQTLSKMWLIPFDGSGAKVLIEDASQDVEDVIQDDYSPAPLGAWLGGPTPVIRWLDAATEARHKALMRTFGGRDVWMSSRSQDGSRVVAHISGHSLPATYFLVDFKKGTADVIGETYPALEKAVLGQARAISYEARDGARIPAYLTTPPNRQPEKLPLVVVPHEGPETRDAPVFDWLAQFLATRGYAVLQPQFRGSTGFGEAHRKAGYRQWGGVMQDDVTDGVKFLMGQGLADPQRICIVGISYGGYAALAGAAFTPELYRCAASVNGISDLPGMLGHVSKHFGDESDAFAYLREHIGSPFDEKVIAKSPARAAANIRAAILLLHGSSDTVVPASQSEAMVRALRAAGKQHTYMQLPDEDHWLSRGETRIRILKALEIFLQQHLVAQ